MKIFLSLIILISWFTQFNSPIYASRYLHDSVTANGVVDGGEYREIPHQLPPIIHHSSYDDAGRVTDKWDEAVGGASYPHTVYAYDKASNVTDVTDQLGIITHNDYDRCHELTMTTVDYGNSSHLNLQTKYEYDMVGRQIKVTAGYGTALAQVTETVYDDASRVEKRFSYPSGSSTELYATHYDYNKRGQQTKIYDAEGWLANPQYYTEYVYEKGGRLERVINAKGDYTRYAYDLDGNKTDLWYVRDSNEVNTHYTYYNNHLLHTTVYPGFSGTNTTTNDYDENGNLTSKLDANGQTITYAYDNNNRLTGKSYSGPGTPNSTVAYTYDASSNLLTVQDDNTDTENVYDDLNRLTTVTNKKYPYPYKVIQYAYYDDGLRESMDGPEANDTVEYTYDNAKRLKTVTRDSNLEATYEYNELGAREVITYGNSSVALYYYNDTTKWLEGLYNQTSTSTIISSFDYTHDLVGNRKSMTLANGDVVSYTHDATYQLTVEQREGSITYTNIWTYDKVGNRESQEKWDGVITTTTSYDYNDANQLISSTDTAGTTIYTFDANGNQTDKALNGNTWEWEYDYENRQISYTDPVTASNSATYTYNASGTRIAKTVNSVTEKYLLDGANVIVDYDSSNNVVASYVTPFLDQNLLVITGGNTYYYLMDGLGSVRELVDSSTQQPVNSYDYYAFGEILSESESIIQRYKFTGREWDNESSTYHYRTRQYNPYTGRFNRRDPIAYGGGIGLYNYVNSNPINAKDSFGLLAFSFERHEGVNTYPTQGFMEHGITVTTINSNPADIADSFDGVEREDKCYACWFTPAPTFEINFSIHTPMVGNPKTTTVGGKRVPAGEFSQSDVDAVKMHEEFHVQVNKELASLLYKPLEKYLKNYWTVQENKEKCYEKLGKCFNRSATQTFNRFTSLRSGISQLWDQVAPNTNLLQTAQASISYMNLFTERLKSLQTTWYQPETGNIGIESTVDPSFSFSKQEYWKKRSEVGTKLGM